MIDLVQFLRARLDEDERIARGHQQWSPSWHQDDSVNEIRDDENAGTVATVYHLGDRTHIARHDPARVLAEVHTKRQLLEASNAACPEACATEHSFSGSCSLRWMGPVHEADGQRWLEDDTGARFVAPPVTSEWALRVLGLPYASHPGYQAEWRPDRQQN